MKEKLGKRIFKNSLVFFVFIFAIEIIIKFNIESPFWDWSTFRIALGTVMLSVIIGMIVARDNKWWRNISATLIALFILIYSWVEVNLFHYLGFFMGAGNAEQGTKVMDYLPDMVKSSKWETYLTIIPFVLIVLYYWWFSKLIRQKKLQKTIYFNFKLERKLSKVLTYLVISLGLILLGVGYYATLKLNFMQNKLQSVKNTTLFIYPENANLAVSQFGVLTYCVTDLTSQALGIEVDEMDDFGDYPQNNNHQPPTNPDLSRNIDDYSWEQVIANEKNTTYNKINKYLINREITPKNDYTGIFEGKNLIYILMESVNDIAINEEYFPNIYKLYSEGISFRNNYTPKNSCSTGNNEMTAMTSLFTINNTCTANTYKNNKYFQAVFNQFNNAGYQTSSYHNYVEFYYYRKTIHPNMGSMSYRNAAALSIPWSSVYEMWPSDVALVEKATPYFINEDKFMAFLTTVSTHQPYSISSNMGDKHIKKFSGTKYSTAIKRYLSKMTELDAAIGSLLQKLEEAGKLEDTVIALFADHYPYGLTNGQIKEVLPYNVSVRDEVDRTPMIIYNAGTEPEQVYKYTSIIDLLPTLLNMFNLNYDPRLYFGHDIFSDHPGRTVFAEGSWQDSVGYYSATSGKFTPINDENKTYTKEELVEINAGINAMQKTSALAIRNNYFNYLDKALAKYPKQLPLEEITEE